MHIRRANLALVAAACAVTSACATSSRVETVETGEVARAAAGTRLTANLTPENRTTVMGSVVVEPMTSPDRMRIRIDIQGAPANSNLPWGVHRGTCTADLGAYGGQAAYPMIGTASDGRGEIQTVVSAPPPSSTSAVRVFAGPGSNIMVACGELRPESSGD